MLNNLINKKKFGLIFDCKPVIRKNYIDMVESKIAAIKDWINTMGFELIKSHDLIGKEVKINYYSLGNFGIYEEISNKKLAGHTKQTKMRFISWNPWGIDFEVTSLNALKEAYQDSKSYSPEMV